MRLYMKAIVWCLFIALVLLTVELHGDGCQTPPWSGLAIEPNFTFTFGFMGEGWTTERKAAVIQAINSWAAADQVNGLNTTYQLWQEGGADANLTFEISDDVQAGWAGDHTTYDINGAVIGAQIRFTSSETYLESPEGYKKVALHELGHVHGTCQ